MSSFVTDRDMGARHRARAHSIQIMKVEEIAASKCRRPAVKQFHVSDILLQLLEGGSSLVQCRFALQAKIGRKLNFCGWVYNYVTS